MAKEAKKKTSKKKSKGGRPTKFDKAQMLLIEYMAKEGKIDTEIAEAIGVSIRTFHSWKKDNAEYLHSLKDWKATANEKVERSLFERAMGYSTTETRTYCHEGMIVSEDVVKNYPPDPTSMIFFLKNRDPKRWRDKVETEHSTKDDKGITLNYNLNDANNN